MIPLAIPSDLELFLKETFTSEDNATAALLLEIASGMVRDELEVQGWSLDAAAADVVLLDPVGGRCVFLPLPVTAVTLVETFDGTAWSTADPGTYTVSKRLGIVAALPGTAWPYLPETWRVTYDHGFSEVPSTILGVVLGVAAREWATPVGIEAETFGPHTVKYQMEADGFTAIERKALAKYANPRIA